MDGTGVCFQISLLVFPHNFSCKNLVQGYVGLDAVTGNPFCYKSVGGNQVPTREILGQDILEVEHPIKVIVVCVCEGGFEQ